MNHSIKASNTHSAYHNCSSNQLNIYIHFPLLLYNIMTVHLSNSYSIGSPDAAARASPSEFHMT